VKLSVLCDENMREKLIEIILKETTSIGVRFYRAERKTLHREIKSVNTKYGNINVKVSYAGKEIKKSSTEYEDCKQAAKKFNVPLLEVMKEAASSGKSRR
ncbi:MAG: nickel insertion protein, partial [Nitrospirota bacterium]